jgi:hypothetical protein
VLPIPGRRLVQAITFYEHGFTNRDHDVTPPVYVGWDHYSLWTTPDPN